MGFQGLGFGTIGQGLHFSNAFLVLGFAFGQGQSKGLGSA